MRFLAYFLLSSTIFFSAIFPYPNLSQASPQVPSYEYLSPSPGSRNISPQTSLAIRTGQKFEYDILNPAFFSVIGSKSGNHSGSVRLSDDQLTLLFYPDRPFHYGEMVSVSFNTETAIQQRSYPEIVFRFSTLPAPIAPPNEYNPYEVDFLANDKPVTIASESGTPNYYTHPEFSTIISNTVTTPPNGTDAGLIFVASMGIPLEMYTYLLIYDQEGEPVYINRLGTEPISADFKVQTVNGIPKLVYNLGVLKGPGWASGTYYVMDQSYSIVDSWTIGNGYESDFHDIQLLDNGHALLLSYTPIPWDLSPYGGPEDGTVMDIIIQEQDSDKNVVFEWHGSQHIPLTDTHADLTQSPVDYIHTNAIDLDLDGNLLISSRHLSEITKINRQNGEIIWRLGGEQNQFTFTNDDGFSYQHDIRRQPNGNITLFDNGNQHNPPYSRAVEYEINEKTKTITRTWQYPEDKSIFALFMGNNQRLSNGNSMIGWGPLGKITEVQPDGTKAFEMVMSDLTYRGFRFPWNAVPAVPPQIALVDSGEPSTATLFFSWNGATDVSAYDVYAGPTPDAMSVVTTTLKTGFETSVTLTHLDPTTCVFKVQPIQAGNLEPPFSGKAYRIDKPDCRYLFHFYYFPLIKD